MTTAQPLPGNPRTDTNVFFPPLTLREWYAGLAMLGYHAGRPDRPSDPILTPEVVAIGCVRYADALIAELGKPVADVEVVDLRDMNCWDEEAMTGRKVPR